MMMEEQLSRTKEEIEQMDKVKAEIEGVLENLQAEGARTGSIEQSGTISPSEAASSQKIEDSRTVWDLLENEHS